MDLAIHRSLTAILDRSDRSAHGGVLVLIDQETCPSPLFHAGCSRRRPCTIRQVMSLLGLDYVNKPFQHSSGLLALPFRTRAVGRSPLLTADLALVIEIPSGG